MAEVARRLPSVRLDFVGDGPGRKECEQLAHELGVAGHCSFAGGVPHPEVLSRMAGAWATVVPSRAEAFGLVNIESLAVGTPVIGSATGGIAEIVRDRVDGLLFPPGDHKALARCMIELAQNQALRNQMSVSCRQRFLDHFELSRAVKTQADWLCGLIENKSRTIEHRKQEPVVCTP
jgi:glycosyltransferase involved in cell wall biosynthesis